METKDFSTSEVDLMDVVDTLQRAISILEKEIVQNVAFLLKKISTRESQQRRESSHRSDRCGSLLQC